MASAVPDVVYRGQSHRAVKTAAPLEWSLCSWVRKIAAIESAGIPRRIIRRSISRAERPASTSTRVPPDSTTHALPPEPEARMVTRTEKMYQKGRTNYVRPVEPNPPSSLAVGASFCACVSFARVTGATTSCAMRSPRDSVTVSEPRLARMTFTSPR